MIKIHAKSPKNFNKIHKFIAADNCTIVHIVLKYMLNEKRRDIKH